MEKLRSLKLADPWASLDHEADLLHAAITQARENGESSIQWPGDVSPVVKETLKVNGFRVLDKMPDDYSYNSFTLISW